MDKKIPETPVTVSGAGQGVVASGWLAATTTFGPKDEHWLKRLTGASGASLALHGLLLALVLFVFSLGPAQSVFEPPPLKADLVVHLQTPGPGGGGGGSPAPAPPKAMEIPKPKAPEPIPVTPPPPVPVTPPPPIPVLNTPVVTADASVLQASGLNSVSLASYGGGGRGGGIGSGTGNGVGEGTGGGFGGGAYQPGSGVSNPTLLRKEDPKYTSEAMRAKIQGEVWLDVIVMPDGTVGDVRVARSLDRTFGLDQEAMKAAKLWRFKPGMFQGRAVPVQVTLILEFRLH
ncbi:MAG: TonB family protein [Vicinamibacterales bacterium]